MTEEKFKKCKDLDNDIRIINRLFEEKTIQIMIFL